jgi:hypothetical protein
MPEGENPPAEGTDRHTFQGIDPTSEAHLVDFISDIVSAREGRECGTEEAAAIFVRCRKKGNVFVYDKFTNTWRSKWGSRPPCEADAVKFPLTGAQKAFWDLFADMPELYHCYGPKHYETSKVLEYVIAKKREQGIEVAFPEAETIFRNALRCTVPDREYNIPIIKRAKRYHYLGKLCRTDQGAVIEDAKRGMPVADRKSPKLKCEFFRHRDIEAGDWEYTINGQAVEEGDITELSYWADRDEKQAQEDLESMFPSSRFRLDTKEFFETAGMFIVKDGRVRGHNYESPEEKNSKVGAAARMRDMLTGRGDVGKYSDS